MERYARFHKALKDKYPSIQLVSSAGPSPDDKRFKFAWPRLRELKADIVDEHCYANPEWFFKNAHRYDEYDPNGPKVFMGEYAAQSDKIVSVKNRNNLECALAEAAYMTGLERNAAVVRMASYAPLFAHIDAWQWTPNLIWTDNLRTYGTPNYYVQKLFSRNRGEVVLPIKVQGSESGSNIYASAVKEGNEVILKFVNPAAESREVVIQLEGARSVRTGASAEILAGDNLMDENNFDSPTKISPRQIPLKISATTFHQVVPKYALMVMRVPIVNR